MSALCRNRRNLGLAVDELFAHVDAGVAVVMVVTMRFVVPGREGSNDVQVMKELIHTDDVQRPLQYQYRRFCDPSSIL